jgi:hypothetical protein
MDMDTGGNMKGREGIVEIRERNTVAGGGIALTNDSIIYILRSHGWHHESDIVEGKTITEDCDGYEGCADECGECAVRERDGRPDMMLTMTKTRPATIRDLIGGKG